MNICRMKPISLAFCAAIVTGFSSFIFHPPVAMATGEGTGAGATVGDNIEASVQFSAPPNTGATSECSWRVVTNMTPSPVPRTGAISVRNRNGILETLYARVCPPREISYHWIPDTTSPRIAEYSQNRVSKLVNMLLTKTAPPADKMVVNVGTWFWVPRNVWKPLSVTAYIPTSAGPITVTTTATPSTLLYSPGDGSDTVSCTGPGTPWANYLGDEARSNCMFTYRHSSVTRTRSTFSASMAISWKVTWRSNLGLGGTLPSIKTGTGLRAHVTELQALSR